MNIKHLSFVLLAAMVVSPFQCKHAKHSDSELAPVYNPLVAAFTSGIVSSEATVKIKFAEDFPDSIVPNTTLDENVIILSPHVNGETYYINQRTIEFRPTERLKQGESYDVKVKLNKLFTGTEDKRTFDFSIHTIAQNISIDLDGFRPYNDYEPELNYITGVLYTADIVDPSKVEAVINVVQREKKLLVSWDHMKNGKQHHFTIDSVLRVDTDEKVIISFDGSPIDAKQSGEEIFTVPSLGSFQVISHKVIQYPEQHVKVSFSDPIKKNQYLNGLIRLETDTDMRFTVEGNNIYVYPDVRQSGTISLYIEPGIKNVANKGLKKGERISVIFEEIKPAVQLLGNGVIIPQSEQILLPFKAVNLKAVDVKIIQIYEDNIAQFLQVNELSGSRELKRAGRLIIKKRIDLFTDKAINYGEWNTFSLNLTDLIKTVPGAIYRIELGFRKAHSLYPCNTDEDGPGGMNEADENFDDFEEEEISYWDSYENYYSTYDYYYYDGYEWEDREDPCKLAYFGNRRSVSRNILSSNLGIIAKMGSDEQLVITVTDLLKASPLQNVSVKVYNFQQQILSEGSTNNDGIIIFNLKSTPFLVIAEGGGNKGYLKLNDGSALSYSMFDVSGTVIKKGLRGFVYGERGVWRPGDSIFINFILDDAANPLPDEHPVVFELKNPQGKIVSSKVHPGNGTGFFAFHTRTEPDAPTGNYTVYAKAGGTTFTRSLSVETIKPNRLKIDLTFENDTLYPDKGPVKGTLYSKWLTGATARSLKADVEVLLRSAKTVFKGYEGYIFEDPSKQLYPYPSSFYSGYLDESGNAQMARKLEISGKAPGMLNALFTTRVFEKSGDFSIDQISVPCSPFGTYVGIKTPEGDKRGMLLTDTIHKIDVVTLDDHGKPVTRPGLKVEVYKLNWRWWWESSSESLSSYIGRRTQSIVFSRTISTKLGRGSFEFKIDYPEWGRYLILIKDENGGHSTGKIVYIDWPGWAGRSKKGDPDAAVVLSFSAEKTKYNVGENAIVTIPSSSQGNILVSIENGSGVIRQEWIKTTGANTKFSFGVTPEMTPNVYVYASLIQPHMNTENDLPIRMFGVIPIMVEDPSTHLSPVLNMPDELSPNSTVKVMISEANRREMTYTIAMVDEGLLDLTRFRTPDPWSSFYSREALGVKTWDMFEYVLGAYGGRIDGIYNIGGGMDEDASGGAKEANRFPPMVKFAGPFTLKGKSNTHTIEIPNYIGSVRTMIIAGHKGAYGYTDKTTPVKQPLMVLATLPRVLGPGEEVNLPVNVFVMDEKIKNVSIDITTNEYLIIKENSKKISFNGTGDEIVEFRLKIPEKTGIGKINIKVASGRESAEYDIELNIRSSNPHVTKTITAAVDADATITKEISYIGMAGTNELVLEVSNIPPVDFSRRLKYLLRYPYGCIEQTTSAVFPQLYLADVMEITDAVKFKTEENVKAGIKKLSSFQLSDGSFSYWPGRTEASSWGTSYAGHFMVEAGNKGYNVPKSLINNWKKYQKKAARRWSLSGKKDSYEIKQQQLMQAYRLFTLALAGDPELGAMNRLRERLDLLAEAKWRLAAAYALAGQKQTALELTKDITSQVDEYNDSRYSFGSATRDRAMILEAMVLMEMRNEAVPLLEMVAQSLSGQRWMSTQTTAYSLIAVAKFTGGLAPKGNLMFEYSFNSEETRKAETSLSISQISFDPGEQQSGKIKVFNKSESMIYVRIVNTGVPPPGKEEPIKQNLTVNVDYFDMEGKRIDVSRIRHGTDFKAVYTISNPGVLGYYDNLALTAIYPSGWEIHNERLFNTTNQFQLFNYQDIRDDRMMTYFSLNPRKTKKYTIRLNAGYKGKFYLPSIKAEEMYRNDIQVLIPGRWIEVTDME